MTDTAKGERDLVFVSYSHKDAEWLDRLLEHLKPYERKGTIKVWVDRRIEAGERWKEQIRSALGRARVAVLLVSRPFLASDFIDKHELPELLGVEKQELSVVWVPVGPSNYQATEVDEYQAAFDPARTLAEMGEAEAERNLVVVSEKIVRAYLRRGEALAHRDRQLRADGKNRRLQQAHDPGRDGVGVEVTEKGGVELVRIPGGRYVMGSPETELGRDNDEDQREVVVEPFLLGRYPVTNEQYGRFMRENPRIQAPKFWSDGSFNQAQQPVVGVSWHEAVAFTEWAEGRLPTEVEWEYACRARTTTATYAGKLTSTDVHPVLDGIAWYSGNSGHQPQVVGRKAANAWGLYDMLGNVWEWCSDGAGSGRVLRGGSWNFNARFVRAADRTRIEPDFRYVYLGFRLARGQGVAGK